MGWNRDELSRNNLFTSLKSCLIHVAWVKQFTLIQRIMVLFFNVTALKFYFPSVAYFLELND